MAIVGDAAIYPLMERLAGCLCGELEISETPGVCYCGVITGVPVLDFCGGGGCETEGCGGSAWVRLVDVFPSDDFPSPSSRTASCFSPLAFTIQVGIARCAPMGRAGGINGYVPPTTEEHERALMLQTQDIATMYRAIRCCFGNGDVDHVLGVYTQIEVQGGGCLGGEFSVTVWQRF